MKSLLLITVIILCLGPLRRNARFFIPAAFGLFIGFGVGFFAARMAGLPEGLAGLVGLATAIGLACSLGEAFKRWCDRVFGPRQQQRRE